MFCYRMFYMELGSLAEWCGAIASIVTGIFAILFAWMANREAKKANDEAAKANEATKVAQEQAMSLEKERDLRLAAGNLLAWWVVCDGNEWGVLVTNTGANPSMLQDVAVRVSGNENRIRASVLPPGAYFYSSPIDRGPWGVPEIVTVYKRYEPVTNSPNHEVEEITFRDLLGSSWVWDPRNGTRRLKNTH